MSGMGPYAILWHLPENWRKRKKKARKLVMGAMPARQRAKMIRTEMYWLSGEPPKPA